MRLKHAYLAFFIGVLTTLVMTFAVSAIVRSVRYNRAVAELDSKPEPTGFVLDTSSGLFRSQISTITADDTASGTEGLLLSPSGRYLVFETLHGPNPDNPTIHERAYVADLMYGTKKELIGQVVWPWLDDDVLTTTEPGWLHVFDMHSPDSPLESFPITGRALGAAPSPDRKTLAISTDSGIVLADRPSGTQRTLSDRPNTAATAWFSDNTRILGYRPSGEDGLDAGPLKELAIWDTGTRDSDGLMIEGLPGTIRRVGWLVQDEVALVATGWDDGLFFYSVNLATQQANLLGEASELWYDSVDYGQVMPRLTLLTPERLTSRSYRQNIVTWVALGTDTYRNDPTLADYTTAIYRSGPVAPRLRPSTNAVTKLDLTTGIESTMFRSDQPILDLVVTRDTTGVYWIAMTESKLIVRKLED